MDYLETWLWGITENLKWFEDYVYVGFAAKAFGPAGCWPVARLADCHLSLSGSANVEQFTWAFELPCVPMK